MTQEHADKIVKQALALLGEHFDASLVLVSYINPDGTKYAYQGTGNHFARIGMATDYMQHQKTITSSLHAPHSPPPPPDDGDSWKRS